MKIIHTQYGWEIIIWRIVVRFGLLGRAMGHVALW